MSWVCFMSEESWQPGAMWFVKEIPADRRVFGRPLSPEYARDWEGKRMPLVVMIPARRTGGEEPAGWPFCVDTNATDSDHGWVVTGEAPLISVSPSVHAVGVYHGWLIDGVISDGLV